MIVITVEGRPIPQNAPKVRIIWKAARAPRAGFLTAIWNASGMKLPMPLTYPANIKKIEPWKQKIQIAAKRALEDYGADRWDPAAPMAVGMSFYLRCSKKPRHPKYRLERPDLENLWTPIANALQGIIYDDDSQIVEILGGSGKYNAQEDGKERAIVTISNQVRWDAAGE